MNKATVDIDIDLSEVGIDWFQSVEIVDHGVFHNEWRLRDPDVGITVSGESYLEARRYLSEMRRVYERTKEAAEQAFDREMRRVARETVRVGVRGPGGTA